MNLHVDERGDTGAISFFLDGDLQFDSTDEAIYHEALALPALCLATPGPAASGLRVLICGGGDGLALREALRFPGVVSVDLVDISEDVVDLGRTRFASINDRSFADARVTVHIEDAFAFLGAPPDVPYDVIICDFSIPRRSEDAIVFTSEWYALTARVLSRTGVLAINGVSPQRTPEAFWCLEKTITTAGLSVLPFRVCIPSFLNQGFGVWGFYLAAHGELRRDDLLSLSACPAPTRGVDLARLFDAAEFDAADREYGHRLTPNTLTQDTLVPLLLNPGRRPAMTQSMAGAPWSESDLPSLDRLFEAIPTLHPYHTRDMIEQVAEQVVGTVRSIDLKRLLDALLLRASEFGDDLRRELRTLRDYIVARSSAAFAVSGFGAWAERLMIALALLLTLANVVAPDNAFGKGGSGLGHASVSRGYSSGSFGHSGEGSFGSGRSGYASGRGPSSFGSFRTTSSVPDAPISGRGFRYSYAHGEPTDIFGNSYSPRMFRYRPCGLYGNRGSDFYIGSYGGGGSYSGSGSSAPPEQSEPARFVADDDMLVLDNGDVIITLSDSAYLMVSQETVALYSTNDPSPLMSLYADPRLFENIQARLRDQSVAAQREEKLRRDWLSWVSWAAAFSPAIESDEAEVANLVDLQRRLLAAETRIGTPRSTPPPDLPQALTENAVELFVDGGLLADGRIALIGAEGAYYFTDGKTLVNGTTGAPIDCPPDFARTLQTVLLKLQKELTADQGSLAKDLITLQQDRNTLNSDLAQYNTLKLQYGSSYEVDYGTSEIPASEAISRTEADIAQNNNDVAATMAEQQKNINSLSLIAAALPKFAP